MGYTILELSDAIGRTPSMIYVYFKKDKESEAFFFSHRKKIARGYIYDEAVLERLKQMVRVSNGEVAEDQETDKEKNPNTTAPADAEAEARVQAINAELEECKKELSEIRTALEQSEIERKQLLEQNGYLLMLLAQEKAEKQKLLPMPRKTIGERIKDLFKPHSMKSDT